MHLIVQCSHCDAKNKAPHYHPDRIEYAKIYGDHFELTCHSCVATSTYHVDDIMAEKDELVSIIKKSLVALIISAVVISLLSFMIFTFLTAFLTGIILNAVVVAILNALDDNSTINFNKYKLKGRISGVNFIKTHEATKTKRERRIIKPGRP